MKRRRGSKKGKAKKPKLMHTIEAATNVVSLSTEENSGQDDSENDVTDSGTEAEKKPSSVANDPPAKVADGDTAVDPEPEPEPETEPEPVRRPIDNTFGRAVYTRVRVKIKPSKALDSQRTSSDAPAQSDTDKSSQQVGSDKQGVPNEKVEDSANSAQETVQENPTRKSVGIKIKSRGFGSSAMSPCSNAEFFKEDVKEKKEFERPQQESRHNEQELKAALEVIRKVMKMDAAQPFNVPVNPVALGIPDYFDVIDTPMDFGTVCNNLEKGEKYMNSEDVYKDVQYIWNNCYTYNNKGDYIVELMKRVKKSFLKYWIAAGLYCDEPQEGVESNQDKDVSPSSDGNAGLSLSGKKFHGLKKHKDGCLCAICVMMRRRQEREEIARMMGGHPEGSEDSLNDEMKQEGASCGQSPFGGYSSSNVENSPDEGLKLGDIKNLYSRKTLVGKGEGSSNMQSSQRYGEESSRQYLTPMSGGDVPGDAGKENSTQHDENVATDPQQPKEKLDKIQRAKMLENLQYLENPVLLELYGTLFANKRDSFWSGPHSLVQTQPSNRKSSLHAAISTFMK